MSNRFTPFPPTATAAQNLTQSQVPPPTTANAVESSYVEVIMRQSSQITELQKANHTLNETIERQAAIIAQLTDDKQKLEAKVGESERKFSMVQEAFGNSVNQSFQYQRVMTEMVKECDALRKHIEELEKKLAAKEEADKKIPNAISSAMAAKFPQSSNGFAAGKSTTTVTESVPTLGKMPDELQSLAQKLYGRSCYVPEEKPNFSFKCPPKGTRPSLLSDYEIKNTASQLKPGKSLNIQSTVDQQNLGKNDHERSPLSGAETDLSRPFLLSVPQRPIKSLLTDNVLMYPFITQGYSKRILNMEHIRIMKLFETQSDHTLVNDAYNKFVKAFSNVLNAEGNIELSEQMITLIAENAKKWRTLTQDAYRIQYLVFELTRLIVATLRNFTVFDQYELDISKKLAQGHMLKIQTRMRTL
uniref:Uncharacterized protein n=1 Tax=Romanomermis culicivorax TaxID=13658 RepID=A0A915IV07_ROMCU